MPGRELTLAHHRVGVERPGYNRNVVGNLYRKSPQ